MMMLANARNGTLSQNQTTVSLEVFCVRDTQFMSHLRIFEVVSRSCVASWGFVRARGFSYRLEMVDGPFQFAPPSLTCESLID